MGLSMNVKQIQQEDLSLYGLFSLFISNWLTLVVSGFSFAIIALLWAINQPNIYKAETLLMPTADEQSGLGGLAGNFGGLAAMAGVNLPESGSNNTKLALELIQSQSFLGEFIEEYDLKVLLMAAKDWDMEANKIILNEKVFNTASNIWVRKVSAPRKATPSLQETAKVLSQLIAVEQDPKSKFVKISIEFYSPHIAAKWTRNLVALLNMKIRQMDRNEATESIEYLKKIASESYVHELKRVFSSLMEEQLKSSMLAEVRKDYVFKVVDPAVAPELKSKPSRAIIIIIAGFLGGIVGLIIILFRSGKQSHAAKQ